MPKEKETEKEVEKVGSKPMSFNRNWGYGLLAVLILLLVFMAGISIAGNRHANMVNLGSGKFVTGGAFGGGINPGGERGFMRMSGPGHLGGGSVIVNGQTRAEGVVTAVNGSDFTIAGHGSTTNITTNSSTQYQNGNQVKQNDSVVVIGTTANNVLTATQIVINP